MKSSAVILGDAVALALVTLIGFASHAEFSLSYIPRMAASFFPLCIGWYLLAPWFGLYQEAVTKAASQLWRPALVMLFAGPFAAVLRGALLNAPVVPSFAIVLSADGCSRPHHLALAVDASEARLKPVSSGHAADLHRNLRGPVAVAASYYSALWGTWLMWRRGIYQQQCPVDCYIVSSN